MDRAGPRASDADRERAAELLRGHAAVGRLDVDELDERCARALLQPAGNGTLVAAGGMAPLAVRRAFAELEA